MVISVIRTDGTDLRQLTDTSYRDRYPRWSPDGQHIAFRSNRDSHNGIWVMNADGSDQRPVCQGAPATWSPDGLEIATMIAGEGAYICDANEQVTESNPKKLPALGEEGEGVFMPWSWSEKGNLAGHNFGRRVDLVVYSFETQEYRKLNDLGSWPVWLSDSRRMIYMSSPDRPPYNFSIMDTATGKHHEILSAEILGIAPDRLFRWADISPDDRIIYFERRRDEADIWMLTLNEERD